MTKHEALDPGTERERADAQQVRTALIPIRARQCVKEASERGLALRGRARARCRAPHPRRVVCERRNPRREVGDSRFGHRRKASLRRLSG
jgi:hypothetical protein